MKRKKLYIAILLLAGVLTSCKVGKAMSVLIFIYPTVWKDHRIRSASVTRTEGYLYGCYIEKSDRACTGS